MAQIKLKSGSIIKVAEEVEDIKKLLEESYIDFVLLTFSRTQKTLINKEEIETIID